jgi:hypothetical protein
MPALPYRHHSRTDRDSTLSLGLVERNQLKMTDNPIYGKNACYDGIVRIISEDPNIKVFWLDDHAHLTYIIVFFSLKLNDENEVIVGYKHDFGNLPKIINIHPIDDSGKFVVLIVYSDEVVKLWFEKKTSETNTTLDITNSYLMKFDLYESLNRRTESLNISDEDAKRACDLVK